MTVNGRSSTSTANLAGDVMSVGTIQRSFRDKKHSYLGTTESSDCNSMWCFPKRLTGQHPTAFS